MLKNAYTFLVELNFAYNILKNDLSIFHGDKTKQKPDTRRCIDKNFYKGFYDI